MKALFFDVFGTLVDWRSGVAREAQGLLQPLGRTLDWLAFADAWRGEYQAAMQEIRAGRRPYVKLDVVHRDMLETVLPRFGLQGALHEATLHELTLAWHKLDAWPDVRAGLLRLRERFLLAPVSNGNTALMCDIARRNDLRWDAILGADAARDFKPKAGVYLAAADAFALKPEECLMCAAHGSDLAAAADVGMRTAFIARPLEWPGVSDTEPQFRVDFNCGSLLDLATALGA